MAETETPTVQLASGTEMPALGLGTWQLTGDDAVSGVEHALELGYRLIDTALDYYNQREIGEALRSSSVDREDVFLVSKVEEDEDAHAATGDRLGELGVDYLDLCLVHRPPADGSGERLWAGMIRALEEGLTREIGVSNYSPEQINHLTEASSERPAVNQIEWSPFGHSDAVLAHAKRNGIVVQAYSPLTRQERLDNGEVAGIAKRHGKTPAQVLLRWSIQSGAAPVPKAARPEHREEDLDVFDFHLSEAEMETLDGLNEHYSALGGLPYV
jgi:2,5-diketo-D-gluconate reductase A